MSRTQAKPNGLLEAWEAAGKGLQRTFLNACVLFKVLKKNDVQLCHSEKVDASKPNPGSAPPLSTRRSLHLLLINFRNVSCYGSWDCFPEGEKMWVKNRSGFWL